MRDPVSVHVDVLPLANGGVRITIQPTARKAEGVSNNLNPIPIGPRQPAHSGGASLDELLARWQAWRRDVKEHSAEGVARGRRDVLKAFGACGWSSPHDANATDYRAYQDRLKDRRVSPTTRRNHLSNIRTFLAWCVEEQVIRTNPLAGFQIAAKSNVTGEGSRALAIEEVRLLVWYAAWHHYHEPRSKEPRWLLYLFLFWTGLRVGEAQGVRWCDADLEAGRLTVWEDVAKSRTRDVVPLSDEIVQALAWRKTQLAGEYHDRNRLFPAQPQMKRLKKDCEEAGVRPEKTGYHSFRKTIATMMESAREGSVRIDTTAALTRHASRKVLEGSYIDRKLVETGGALSLIPCVFPAGVVQTIGKISAKSVDVETVLADARSCKEDVGRDNPEPRLDGSSGSTSGCENDPTGIRPPVPTGGLGKAQRDRLQLYADALRVARLALEALASEELGHEDHTNTQP